MSAQCDYHTYGLLTVSSRYVNLAGFCQPAGPRVLGDKVPSVGIPWVNTRPVHME